MTETKYAQGYRDGIDDGASGVVAPGDISTDQQKEFVDKIVLERAEEVIRQRDDLVAACEALLHRLRVECECDVVECPACYAAVALATDIITLAEGKQP